MSISFGNLNKLKEQDSDLNPEIVFIPREEKKDEIKLIPVKQDLQGVHVYKNDPDYPHEDDIEYIQSDEWKNVFPADMPMVQEESSKLIRDLGYSYDEAIREGHSIVRFNRLMESDLYSEIYKQMETVFPNKGNKSGIPPEHVLDAVQSAVVTTKTKWKEIYFKTKGMSQGEKLKFIWDNRIWSFENPLNKNCSCCGLSVDDKNGKKHGLNHVHTGGDCLDTLKRLATRFSAIVLEYSKELNHEDMIQYFFHYSMTMEEIEKSPFYENAKAFAEKHERDDIEPNPYK